MTCVKPLPYQTEWTFELLDCYDQAIANKAKEFNLDIYPRKIEIINSEQMIDAYATSGLPLIYPHWSFGKQFIELEKQYRHGQLELAYEIVINSNPCHAYLMAESPLVMQAIVIAHACYGHNAFFKNNFTFKLWSDPDTILEYLIWAKQKILDHEKRHGIQAVEKIIDACHALKTMAIHHYPRKQKLSLREEEEALEAKKSSLQEQVNVLWHTLPSAQDKTRSIQSQRYPTYPEENILQFIEENAPHLAPWEREVIHIIRSLAQYFYPQRQTKMMNEGYATFWHYQLIQSLYDDGYLTDEFMMQFIQYHSQVISQSGFDDTNYYGINPYNLGYKIFQDIKRTCEDPSEEDRHCFPDLVNQHWTQAVDFAMRNFKDESFVSQYLSPRLIRELKLFTVLDDSKQSDLEISAIHDAAGYGKIRQTLSNMYNLSILEPNIQVYHADIQGDHSLTLRHYPHRERPLSPDTPQVLKQIYQLWGHPVHCESVTEAGSILSHYSYPELISERKAA